MIMNAGVARPIAPVFLSYPRDLSVMKKVNGMAHKLNAAVI